MTPDFTSLYHALKRWTTEAIEAGWLTPNAAQEFDTIEQQQVGELFRQHPHRPLIVGLFGGTGVGKSSLLNRLAGEEVARVGVERPTSHEVTLYLHKDFKLDLLPPELPMEETRIAYHSRPERRLIAWLDMPDIDSTATHNREIVQSWLPYVDWIIYVVSPDRYYDDIGWRFLQERAGRHAWIFVMNHWDQGTEEQIDDLRRRLQAEGFKDPLILRTVGIPNGQKDDFDKLEEIINDAINRYGLDILQQLGIQARNRDLKKLADKLADELGSEEQWRDAATEWSQTVATQTANIGTQLQTQADALSRTLLASEAQRNTSLLSRLKPGGNDPEPLPEDIDKLTHTLWNARNQARLESLNEQLVNQLQTRGLPWRAFRQPLDAMRDKATTIMEQAISDGINAALANPGGRWQRLLYRSTGVLSWLLPLIAALWAVSFVITSFYAGTQGEHNFLGLNFLLHSAMLIGLGWLVPWLLHIKLKPSVNEAVRQGLRIGIDKGIAELKQHYKEIWEHNSQLRAQARQQLNQLRQDIDQLEASPLQELGGLIPESTPQNSS